MDRMDSARDYRGLVVGVKGLLGSKMHKNVRLAVGSFWEMHIRGYKFFLHRERSARILLTLTVRSLLEHASN